MIEQAYVNKIVGCIKRHRVKCRSIDMTDDRLMLGIESTKYKSPSLYDDLRKMRLIPINITYGRWIFGVRDNN